MNIASDPKSIPQDPLLSPEANQLAALPTANGILTVDLDAIIANWRKLEKTAVPAECAAVVKANAYGCGAEQVSWALASAGCRPFRRRYGRAAVVRAVAGCDHHVLGGFFRILAMPTPKWIAGQDRRPQRVAGWTCSAAAPWSWRRYPLTPANRLGLTSMRPRASSAYQCRDHGITLVMSHLASSEQLNSPRMPSSSPRSAKSRACSPACRSLSIPPASS
jgi:alanine racemase